MEQNEETQAREAEAGLVARLKQGEAAAWQELCECYGEPLYLYAFHRAGGDPAVADDVRQETLLAAVQSIGRYRGEAPLFGWLCGIARHRVGDALRRAKRSLSLSQVSEADEDCDEPLPDLSRLGEEALPEGVVESSQARAALVRALWSLPGDYRAALLRRYLRGESVEAVAQRLGRSYKATESLLERARQSLRRLLKEMET